MWITKDTDPIWVKMELNACGNVPLEALPFLNEVAQKRLRVGNEWIRKTMKKWTDVRKKFKLSNSICRATKIATNPDFIPSTMDAGFKRWADKGLICIEQVFMGQTLKSFEQLGKNLVYQLRTTIDIYN